MNSLLILTQYYPPEIGAPQNRLHELAVRLKANGLKVEVLTAMPNYPKMEIFEAYKNGRVVQEEIDGITVYRSKIYVSKSKGIVSRLLNYFSFVWTSYWRGRKLSNYNYLMVESPPLFLGYCAMALSRKLKAKMIFNVSDLWPESAEKMGLVTNQKLLKLAYNLEEKCYKKAWKITGQTQGIVKDIESRFKLDNVRWLPNGVNIDYYNPSQIEAGDFREKLGIAKEAVVYFYGGIIGHAQGLETLLKAGKLLEDEPNVVIVLQGAGPEKDKLMQMKKDLNLTNVIFNDPVTKQEMPAILKSVDVALVPLRKLLIFEGAIPSKVFEALAMELPLLLGVDGEARLHFETKAGAALFCEPENENVLAENIRLLANDAKLRRSMGEKGRAYVKEHFNRDKIAASFLKELN